MAGSSFRDDGVPEVLKITLTENREAFISQQKLGPDALDVKFDLEAFRKALSGSRSTLKSAPINQSLMAGIGNVYSDEIFFQAGIHPKTKAQNLDEEASERLFRSMKDVLTTAIDSRANPNDFRKGKNFPVWLLCRTADLARQHASGRRCALIHLQC